MRIGYFVETPVEHKLTGGVRSFLDFVLVLKNKYAIEPFVFTSEEWEFTEILKKNSIKYSTFKMYRPFVGFSRKSLFFRSRHLIKLINNYFAKKKAVRFFKKNNVDIIHSNSQFTGTIGQEVAKKLKICSVYHIREQLKESFDVCFFNEKYAYSMINNADSIIVVSKSIFDYYKNVFSADKMCIIYNGISSNIDKPNINYFNKDVLNICIIGRISPSKNQLDAVKCINMLIKTYGINAHLYIVGATTKNDYEKIIIQYVNSQGINSYIHFIPFTNNVLDVMHKCQFAFVCSENEAFGRTTAECMSAGLLTFGADSGATSELIENDKNGIIFELGNWEELAKKVAYYNDNRDKAKTLAENGANSIYRNFSIDNTAKSIYNVYCKVLEK